MMENDSLIHLLDRAREIAARNTYEPMPPTLLRALLAVVDAAKKATTDNPNQLAGAVIHPDSCGLWVELDDVSAALHPVGLCDCGLDELRKALLALESL